MFIAEEWRTGYTLEWSSFKGKQYSSVETTGGYNKYVFNIVCKWIITEVGNLVVYVCGMNLQCCYCNVL